MEKILQLILKYVVLPLVTKGLDLLWKYFENSREDSKRDTAIDDSVKKFKDAVDPEEKKDAIKDIVRGVAANHSRV